MEKILTHKRYYASGIEKIDSWKVPEKEKSKVKEFIQAYETGKITGRVGTNTDALIERLLDYLKCGLEQINKDIPTKKDIELFFDNMLKDKIKSYNKRTEKYNGKPYALRSKQSLFSALIKYYKWKFPDKPELQEPLRIHIKSKRPEPKSLSLEEIDKLYKSCFNEEDRYFVAVLFSSGARAEEFHNIRYSDFELPKGEETFVKLRLRNEFTKTEGRTISLYYKYALESVREFLEKRKFEGMKPEDPVFKDGYGHRKAWLTSFGKKVLGKNVYYHLFRHSCATWLANRLNRQQMCIYFGWQFSSSMPDVYINRKGVAMEEVTTKFQSTEMEDLKTELDKQKNDSKFKEERLEALETELVNRKQFDKLLNKLLKKPEVMKMLE